MKNGGKRIFMLLKQFAGILAAAVCLVIHLYPVFIIFSSALKSKSELAFNPSGIPEKITFEHFSKAFDKMNYLQSTANTIIIVTAVVCFILIAASMAAYAISRKGGKYNWIYFLFLAGLMMPFQLRMIPLYKMMADFKLVNKLIGTILVYCGSQAPMAVFLLSGFVKTVPRELEEAAQIDGAGIYYTFFAIVFPLLKSPLVTVGILCTFSIWNDFLMPMLFLQAREKLTITVTLANFQGLYANDWSMIFAGVCLIVFPMLIIYLIAQKYIINGITAGAVKG